MRHKWKSLGPFSQFAQTWENAHKTRSLYQCTQCNMQKVWLWGYAWGYRRKAQDRFTTLRQTPKCKSVSLR